MMQRKIVVAGAAVLAVALALPAGAVLFSGGGGDSRCDEAHNAFTDLSDQARAVGAEADSQRIADTQALLVLSATECFVPADVARAQQHLDTMRAR